MFTPLVVSVLRLLPEHMLHQAFNTALGTSCCRTLLLFSAGTADTGTVSSSCTSPSPLTPCLMGSTAACQGGLGLTRQAYSAAEPQPKSMSSVLKFQDVMKASTCTARRDRLRTCTGDGGHVAQMFRDVTNVLTCTWGGCHTTVGQVPCNASKQPLVAPGNGTYCSTPQWGRLAVGQPVCNQGLLTSTDVGAARTSAGRACSAAISCSSFVPASGVCLKLLRAPRTAAAAACSLQGGNVACSSTGQAVAAAAVLLGAVGKVGAGDVQAPAAQKQTLNLLQLVVSTWGIRRPAVMC